ncbi:hypothetical protein P389DRAFT_167192 [Cystobasidium minutum MCA 4210]|uniref:uncharacterized protein n=1 Tax=Cystobasidium minutum MCA 4210 TaxID=1397322 RepID=UPI0034CEF66F|eukprot:jgi/Rhomi1/167192/fgenesh1_kg.2_\
MGIQGLLPLLKECQRSAHIQEYKGQTLGIDAYVWLHRGAYGCAEELATGQTTVKYVKYALHKLHLLRHYGITPYVVFDGGLLPSKKGTEKDRESRRDEALAKAKALVLQGKHAQARECYVKAVDVTPQMAYQLIKALRAENVAYVVAPYEADAQLAYLEKKGLIDGIITEDSDLLVFGCRKVLFKLDSDGRCIEIKRENFTMCKEVGFSGWSDKEFRQMAILSGCDYLSSIPGLGLKTAHGLMRRYKSAEKVIRFIRLEGQLKVPRDYEAEFLRAELTFVHQRVFCPDAQKLVYLEELSEEAIARLASHESAELKFIGPLLDDHIAYGIARGDLCPLSKAKMIDIAPDAKVLAANPIPAAPPTKGSLKDYFKPSPSNDKSAAKPSTKRNALGELKPNNLFSVKGEASNSEKTVDKPAGKMVKSRFFVPSVKPNAERKKVVALNESDEDEVLIISELSAQMSQEPTKLASTAVDEAVEDAQICRAASGCAAPRGKTEIDEDSPASAQNDDQFRLDLPTINTSREAKIFKHVNLPPMPLPAPAATADWQDPGEITLTASSPLPEERSERPRKLRRYQSSEPDPDTTIVLPMVRSDHDTTPSLSSPAVSDSFPLPSKTHTKERPFSPPRGMFVDLTDLSSPTSPKSPKTILASPELLAEESPGLAKDISVSVLWSDGAIVSDPEHLDAPSAPSSKAKLRSARATQEIREADKRLPRRNAVIEMSEEVVDIDENVEQKMAEFDKRVVSVVAGWRSKFSSSSTKSAKKFPKLRSSSSPSSASKAKARQPLSPRRPAKQKTVPECSSPIISSTPPSVKKPARRYEEPESPVKQNDSEPKKISAALSQNTKRALDAFRYRSSATPSSSSTS